AGAPGWNTPFMPCEGLWCTDSTNCAQRLGVGPWSVRVGPNRRVTAWSSRCTASARSSVSAIGVLLVCDDAGDAAHTVTADRPHLPGVVNLHRHPVTEWWGDGVFDGGQDLVGRREPPANHAVSSGVDARVSGP